MSAYLIPLLLFTLLALLALLVSSAFTLLKCQQTISDLRWRVEHESAMADQWYTEAVKMVTYGSEELHVKPQDFVDAARARPFPEYVVGLCGASVKHDNGTGTDAVDSGADQPAHANDGTPCK